MGFRLLLKSVTLNDLERHNGHYIGLFHRIHQEPFAVVGLSQVLLNMSCLSNCMTFDLDLNFGC